MATINTTDPKPGFVYDSDTDTWYPLVGIAPASNIDQWVKTVSGGETSVSGAGDDTSILSYTPGTEQVYLNGVLLVRNSDYTATNGTSITGFSPALSASDVVEVITYNPSNIEKTNAILVTDINAKGDLIVGTAVDTPGILTAASTSGYILSVNPATATGLEWIANDVGDITAVTSGTGISVSSSTGPVPSIAVDTNVVATTNNTLTMSNKTLTSPTVSGLYLSDSSIVFEGTGGDDANETTLTVTNPTADRTITLPNVSGTVITTGNLSSITSTGTLTDTTLSSPILISPEERWLVNGAGATGTINIDVLTAGVVYYANNATGNFTLNFRGSATTSMNTMLALSDSVTVVFLSQNGVTAYYPTAFQIDGGSVTPKWQGGTAPSAGNASSIDSYVFTIAKTSGTPAYTVLASQTKFA